jgi:glycosyltransferase involved in cell wall biosynthesis
MKILSIHNSYQTPGGEDQVFAQEADLLRSHGHQVLLYQASNDQVKDKAPLVLLGNTIWNRQTHHELRTLMNQEKPDIVHVHNTFPVISPAAYYAANEEGIPVVQTLHNYRPLCPAATLFRNGHVCEDCLGKRVPWRGVMHGCYRGSRLATASGAAMLTTHNYKQTWNQSVAAYIALSDFARGKFIEGGFPAEKIFVKPNFVQSDPGPGDGQGNYAFFAGRLTPEKGISTLLQAWRTIGTGLRLQIAGDGPLAPEVEQACREMKNVTWLKWLPRPEILQRMKKASVLILPSTWYEGFPMTLAEACAVGLPVIASKLGSMASIVDHQRTGLHFESGSADGLVEALRWWHKHPAETALMRTHARLEYETKYTAEGNYVQLISIYESVLNRSDNLSRPRHCGCNHPARRGLRRPLVTKAFATTSFPNSVPQGLVNLHPK